MPSLTTTTFELIQIQMLPFSTTAINENSNAAVVVAGFSINQLPVFPLPALRSTLGNIFDAAIILFYFFLYSIFSYKTLFPLALRATVSNSGFFQSEITAGKRLRQFPHYIQIESPHVAIFFQDKYLMRIKLSTKRILKHLMKTKFSTQRITFTRNPTRQNYHSLSTKGKPLTQIQNPISSQTISTTLIH